MSYIFQNGTPYKKSDAIVLVAERILKAAGSMEYNDMIDIIALELRTTRKYIASIIVDLFRTGDITKTRHKKIFMCAWSDNPAPILIARKNSKRPELHDMEHHKVKQIVRKASECKPIAVQPRVCAWLG